MDSIISTDGVKIAYQRSGIGRPMVLVHGTGIDHTYWDRIVPELSRCFTVYAVDRRGRGESHDSGTYAIEREFEDIACLIDSLPEPSHLVGHSYGALCSLEASLRSRNIVRMVLYEPPIYTTVPIVVPEGAVDKYNDLVASGQGEKALMMMYEMGNVPSDEVAALRSEPNWERRIAAAGTSPREMFGAKGYHFDPARFKRMGSPTLVISGSKTSEFYKAATRELVAALPHCRSVVLAGQGHEGVITAPRLFVREVLRFLTDGT